MHLLQPLRPGDPREIGGYRLRGRLGSGVLGTVYLSHSRGGQPVALKVIRPEFAEDPEFRRRFRQEVGAARRVQGPFTVPVLDSSTSRPPLWLATAHVPGPALSRAVQRHGPLPLDSVLHLVAGVAEALASIHATGVIHRALKPANVLLAADGPRVSDFGIARAAEATSLAAPGAGVSTPAYLAPEQATGGRVTPAADVFSLGSVACYAATGGHAFGEGQAPALVYRIVNEQPRLQQCPEPLRELIADCLAKTPGDRPSPAEVAKACRALGSGTGPRRTEGWLPPAVKADVRAVATSPQAAAERRRREKRNAALRLAVAASSLAAVGVAALLLLARATEDQAARAQDGAGSGATSCLDQYLARESKVFNQYRLVEGATPQNVLSGTEEHQTALVLSKDARAVAAVRLYNGLDTGLDIVDVIDADCAPLHWDLRMSGEGAVIGVDLEGHDYEVRIGSTMSLLQQVDLSPAS